MCIKRSDSDKIRESTGEIISKYRVEEYMHFRRCRACAKFDFF